MNEPIDIVIPEKIRPLIPKFLERTNASLEQLRAALDSGDVRTLQDIGHRLKGTAGGYGFNHLGELAGKLEEAAKSGDAPSSAKLVAEMGDCLARAKIRYV